MTLPVDALIAYASSVLWTFLRIAAFLMVVPVFGNRLVSPRIRVALAFAAAAALGPMQASSAPR